MDDLSRKKCVPCTGATPVISRETASAYLQSLESWTLSADGRSISTEYILKDFASAVRLVQAIAELAEVEDHHPDLHLTGYRKLQVVLSTHAIGGLSENDLILAAKISKLPKEFKMKK